MDNTKISYVPDNYLERVKNSPSKFDKKRDNALVRKPIYIMKDIEQVCNAENCTFAVKTDHSLWA